MFATHTLLSAFHAIPTRVFWRDLVSVLASYTQYNLLMLGPSRFEWHAVCAASLLPWV